MGVFWNISCNCEVEYTRLYILGLCLNNLNVVATLRSVDFVGRRIFIPVMMSYFRRDDNLAPLLAAYFYFYFYFQKYYYCVVFIITFFL